MAVANLIHCGFPAYPLFLGSITLQGRFSAKEAFSLSLYAALSKLYHTSNTGIFIKGINVSFSLDKSFVECEECLGFYQFRQI